MLKCNKVFNKTRIFDENLYYICHSHSTHLFICNNSLYDTLLEVDETKYAVDTFWHKKYRVCILLPFLAFQHNGISNIGEKYYPNIYNDLLNTEKIIGDNS